MITRQYKESMKQQKRVAQQVTNTQHMKGGNDKEEKTISIPYIKGTSEAIRRVLAPLGIRTAMRANKMKWSIMGRAKDKLDKNETPGVVYAVGCTECKDVYIGETRRTVAQRIKEHQADTRLGHTERSAIAEHIHSTGHKVHWEARIIEKEQHGRRRKVKEALHIHRMKQKGGSMNQDSGWDLSRIWLDLVK